MRRVLAVVILTACGGSPKQPAPANRIAIEVTVVEPAKPLAVEATAAEPAKPLAVEATPVEPGQRTECIDALGCTSLPEGGAFESLIKGDVGWGRPSGGKATDGPIPGPGWGTGSLSVSRTTPRTSAVPRVIVGHASGKPALNTSVVRRYIKRNLEEITTCYEERLPLEPGLEGSMTTTFTIGADGKVSASTATGVHAEVAACVAAAIGAIEFSWRGSWGVVEVTLPLIFRPTGG